MYFFVCFALLVVSCSAQVQSSGPDAICKVRNAYLNVDGNCDSYIECRDYHAINKECPDGLHYNADVKWPNYPCGYPADVPCNGRSIIQMARSTHDCPHQFGFFPSPKNSPTDCGHYLMCADGKPNEMYCPTGLAFNLAVSRCDWPENVPSCKASEFLGFTCPPAMYDQDGYPVVTNHKYEQSCYAFFMCISGNARLLSCDPGFAFDPISSRCLDEDLVACDNKMTPYSLNARVA
ncbi:Chondroitin proteoglycan-2 [Danaus plexippus plexippus]|uniref:Chondroitin proteoglycan-2 n=1 Tax=Danaus plexippus plexippus TaxID=278856 RepID=A0A212F4E7_DANPL|nr:Chondroitin proteoglycan-2 [Danaus plexippus plexippus]